MIRVKCEIDKLKFERLINVQFEYEPNVTYKEKRNISDYRYNFYIKDVNVFNNEECSFWLGAGHNSKQNDKLIDVVLDYNPNKCGHSPILNYLIDNIFKSEKYVRVESLDIAVDLPVNINNIKYSCNGNMKRTVIDNGGDNKTYYFRNRNSDGHIKIYNKKRQANLDYELTRYEITIKPKLCICDMVDYCYKVPSDLFIPIMNMDNFQIGTDLIGTDKVLLLACIEHNEYLRELPRKKRKKIEELMAVNNSIMFDFDFINNLIMDYLKSIYTL